MKINLSLIRNSVLVFCCMTGISVAQTKKMAPMPNSLKPSNGNLKAAPQPKRNPQLSKGEKPFVEKMEDGQINWTEQYIEAEGSSVMDTVRFKIPAQARLMAGRGAMVDAQRNLLEIIEGVRVEGQTTVKDMITISDEVKTSVSGLVKGAVPVGKTVYSDGMATVKLRIPLYQNGLGKAVVEEALKNENQQTPGNENVPVPMPTDTAAKSADPMPNPAVNPNQLVLAVEGSYKPTLFPQLTDDQNRIIMDLASKFDPTGKFPAVVKASESTLAALKGKKGLDVIEVVQDQVGNLVLTEKGKSKMDKWLSVGKTIWNIVKSIILPI